MANRLLEDWTYDQHRLLIELVLEVLTVEATFTQGDKHQKLPLKRCVCVFDVLIDKLIFFLLGLLTLFKKRGSKSLSFG